MSQDYYDFIRRLNDKMLKIGQLEHELRVLRPQKIGLRYRLQLRLSDFFLALGLMIRPKLAISGDRDGCFNSKEAYAAR